MINCCLKYKLFVGRGHDPADHLGQLSGKNASKMCKLPEIRYSSVSLRCGGVMTPPYDGVYFNSLNNNLSYQNPGADEQLRGFDLHLCLRQVFYIGILDQLFGANGSA